MTTVRENAGRSALGDGHADGSHLSGDDHQWDGEEEDDGVGRDGGDGDIGKMHRVGTELDSGLTERQPMALERSCIEEWVPRCQERGAQNSLTGRGGRMLQLLQLSSEKAGEVIHILLQVARSPCLGKLRLNSIEVEDGKEKRRGEEDRWGYKNPPSIHLSIELGAKTHPPPSPITRPFHSCVNGLKRMSSNGHARETG